MADKRKIVTLKNWKPKKFQKIVERDGKLLICHFDRLFGNADKLNEYSKFIIGKESYINQLDVIENYTNYFINNYDYDDELVTAYLKIKYCLDLKHLFTEENMNSYIDFLYEVMFTPSMVDKINLMTEDNYDGDIETPEEDKKKFLKNEKKHLESLEFTNKHIKILLSISFGMKIMAAPLFHYIQRNKIKIEKTSEIIYNFYKKLFDIFGYADTYCLYNSNDEIIEEQVKPEVVENFIYDNIIEPSIMSDGEKRYYFSDENGEICYYAKGRINMYNKLFVYVSSLAYVKLL